MSKTVWLIGAGPMAQEYHKVLSALGCEIKTIGRGAGSAGEFKAATGADVAVGGIDCFLSAEPKLPDFAVVSVGVEALATTTNKLIEYGARTILVEKPAGLSKEEIEAVAAKAKHCLASVFVAYNRRFYSSVMKAKQIIAADGGVTSFNFEMTEWSHVIKGIAKADGVKEKWFLANTTHVADLAFHLGGAPAEISSYVSGGTNWHPCSSVFQGAGVTERNALFSYQGNWESPGRWAVEILTSKHRLILKPLERLKIQKIGSLVEEDFMIDSLADSNFKPGLYILIEKLLEGDVEEICSIHEQLHILPVYFKMAGYQ